MYRSLNLRTNSMWSLLVSFSAFQSCSNLLMYYQDSSFVVLFIRHSRMWKKTYTELFINFKTLIIIIMFRLFVSAVTHWRVCKCYVCGLCIRSCSVWRGVQVCHAGSELCVSSHIHTGYAPGPHFTRTVSIYLQWFEFPPVWHSLFSLWFFMFSDSNYFN